MRPHRACPACEEGVVDSETRRCGQCGVLYTTRAFILYVFAIGAFLGLLALALWRTFP